MEKQYCYGNYCKRCYIKINKLSKNDIRHMIMTEYEDKCEKCGRVSELVDYIYKEN